MIKSFRHKGLEAFFTKGSLKGIQTHHAARLKEILKELDKARTPQDFSARFLVHPIHEAFDAPCDWSLKVSTSWRVTFGFEQKTSGNVIYVNYANYHN